MHDGSVAPHRHANRGGGKYFLRLSGREAGGSLVCGAGGKPALVGARPIQDRMEEMKPVIRFRWGHPKALAWYFLDGMLLQVG
jgi:hypothetical protein